MTKFCIVAPPQILEGLSDRGLLGSNHLLLAHDVVKQAKRYEQIFKFRTWSEEMVILDNSVIETGHAVDLGMMHEAINICKPTCAVLPDILLDGEATARSCLNALEEWPKHLGDTTYCYIPQGRRVTEFIASARAIADDSRVTFWGCPRNVVKYHGTRATAMECLKEVNPNRKIHMMGFSDNMIDDIRTARKYNPWSIDSAVPLRLNHPLTEGNVPAPRSEKWWDEGRVTHFTMTNLNIAREWFEGDGPNAE